MKGNVSRNVKEREKTAPLIPPKPNANAENFTENPETKTDKYTILFPESDEVTANLQQIGRAVLVIYW